jgi:transposase
MIGRQAGDQSQLFSSFNREEHIPAGHLRRRIHPIATRVLADLGEKLKPLYRETGRSSIDPGLMLKVLIVGCCYGIRFERKLCEEVELPLAFRWFCRLALDDKVPHHSTFSVNRHGRFGDSDIFRELFEARVRAWMGAGLVKGEGLAIDARVMEADARRYPGEAPDEIDSSGPEHQTRAVAAFLSCLEPHIPAGERYQRADGMFPCPGFAYDAERDIYLCQDRTGRQRRCARSCALSKGPLNMNTQE